MNNKIRKYLDKETSSNKLAVFRIGFGILMLFSLIRFWSKGWIYDLYINPDFHFSYYGFDWVKPIGEYTYLIFLICIISSILITLGLKYRISIILFFISFTYIELMDKTTYLNHYYFISCLSFLMIFIPANKSFSLDSLINKISYPKIPAWSVDSIKLLISIVFIYAGLAKINSDWLLEALPLKIWLTSSYDIPIIGSYFLQKEYIHYIMSWGGMIYDLSIPILLLLQRTRVFAFILVVLFHIFTSILFPIGMFPYIMIFSTIIFFNENTHHKILSIIKSILKPFLYKNKLTKESYNNKRSTQILYVISIFFIFQILFPLRHHLYSGELLWKEEGYRFSWRVMVTEKKGDARFKIVNPVTKESILIKNEDYLTEFQEKQMSFQSDFILEFAHYIGDQYKNKGIRNPEVYVDCFVTLNGRRSQRYIDNHTNLYKEKESFFQKEWILNFNDEIYDI